jgi:hypothetical protein
VIQHLARATAAAILGACPSIAQDTPVQTSRPILFVTQVPIVSDYLTVASTFGNHRPGPGSVPRGGDLWLRYPEGTLRNLTAEAGYGAPGPFQGQRAIAVREPCVHWNGRKAVFSMVVGAPDGPYELDTHWQLYEVTGFARNATVRITRVPGQPADRSNVAPCYASDGRILFASDRMRPGAAHLYPQLDEYEEAPTTTGLWSLDPGSGELSLMNHAPSGVFHPSVDSFGRVVFTRWDHLERDQQADLDRMGLGNYRVHNWSGEAPDAVQTATTYEFFPEARPQWIDFLNGTPGYSGPPFGWDPDLNGNTFNAFFPWTIRQDGTGEETLNHVGRHELSAFVPAARNDDADVVSQPSFPPWSANRLPIDALHQLREDPLEPGTFVGIDCREFDTHASGQIVRLTGAPNLSPGEMHVQYITHRDTRNPTQTPGPDHSGFYRNPLVLTGGRGIAAHTSNTLKDANIGTPDQPRSRFDFRLKELVWAPNGFAVAGRPLTSGIRKRVQWFDPYQLRTHDGELWELDPVEVVPRPLPPSTAQPALAEPEARVLRFLGVEETALRSYLADNDLALLVSRNVTRRDRSDRQQPFNLRVPGGTQTLGTNGVVRTVAWLRLFQGDLVRSLENGVSGTASGRRVLAVPLHAPAADNPPIPGAPPGSVAIAPDGSVAALVPARRAMSWQLLDTQGVPVVNERYWISLGRGEIRTCTSCHGGGELDQALQPPPENAPLALGRLLLRLKSRGAL